MKRLFSFLLRHELLIFILCLISILSLPSLLEPYWYGDEGIYLTVGNGIRHGLTLYKDIHDNNPPIIYLIAAIAGTQFWFRFILLFWHLTTIIVFWWISHELLDTGERPRSWKVGKWNLPFPYYSTLATLLFSLFPIYAEGNIGNGEIFMLLPIMIGMASLIVAIKKRQHQFLSSAIAGISFSIAFLFKVPAIFDACAAVLFFFFLMKDRGPSMKQSMKKHVLFVKQKFCNPLLYVFIISFLIPILISLIHYASVGAISPYIHSAFLQNVGYLSSWKTGTFTPSNLGQSGLKARTLSLSIVVLLILGSHFFLLPEGTFFFLWYSFTLFGVLLSERPYPHYLIQIFAPLCLLLPFLIKSVYLQQKQGTTSPRGNIILSSIMNILFLTIGTAAIVSIHFWSYPILSYYSNYIRFISGQETKSDYLSNFNTTLPEQYKIAAMIVSQTSVSDKIFIWGDLPNIYALTHRLPVGRYTSAYHVKDFNGFDETIQSIQKQFPKIILVDKHASYFPSLSAILLGNYSLEYTSQNFSLYRYTNL